MMAVHITAHAIQRFRERVADLPEAEVRERLRSPFITAAADFGAHVVRLGTGQRIVIGEHCVVTVLPAENYRRTIRRVGRGRFG